MVEGERQLKRRIRIFSFILFLPFVEIFYAVIEMFVLFFQFFVLVPNVLAFCFHSLEDVDLDLVVPDLLVEILDCCSATAFLRSVGVLEMVGLVLAIEVRYLVV